ncbi:MAG: tail fiber domain-containing protein [Bacteroidales bacterium]|nr:tail fiber domain-containing protein [Bacteroidales bacterium]
MTTTKATSTGLFVYRAGGVINTSGTWVYVIDGRSEITDFNHNVGVRGEALMTTAQNTGRTFGVFGRAGNSTSRYNYGTVGLLEGAQNGVGIYGSVNTYPVGVSGRYAGYFEGNVKVTGTLTATNVQPSDKRFKKNIVSLSSEHVLDKVLKMNPIEYNYAQTTLRAAKPAGDTITPEVKMFDEKAQMFQKKHYGLVAQELQQLYPDLVYDGDEGFLNVNYIDIIPLLIQSIKELNGKIERLEAGANVGYLKSGENNAIQQWFLSDNGATEDLKLYQNAPNPFNERTTIQCYIPEQYKKVQLCVYTMQGVQVQCLNITERANVSIEIEAAALSAGIYSYVLLADGVASEAKQMILTK